MFASLPPVLRKAAWALLAAIVGFALSLFVYKPLAYIFTLGIGAMGTLLALVFFLVYFTREVKAPAEE
jgi:hypothetical protein